jgi:hypothetical protein
MYIINRYINNREVIMMENKHMPSKCPSCREVLKVSRLNCENCTTVVEGGFDLSPLARLEAEEQEFLLNFLEASGSLKILARNYGISYPTVRNRLDDLREKVRSLTGKAGDKKGE